MLIIDLSLMLRKCAILLPSHMENHMVGVYGERKTEIFG